MVWKSVQWLSLFALAGFESVFSWDHAPLMRSDFSGNEMRQEPFSLQNGPPQHPPPPPRSQQEGQFRQFRQSGGGTPPGGARAPRDGQGLKNQNGMMMQMRAPSQLQQPQQQQQQQGMPCHNKMGNMNGMSGYNNNNNNNNNLNLDSYFNSESSIDLSFDSLMEELLLDVMYLELLSKQESKGTLLILQNPTQVTGNTYRFNIGTSSMSTSSQQSQQRQPIQYWHQTESFYLCKNNKCQESERIELTSISSNYSPKSGKFNAHLVATTTEAPNSYNFANLFELADDSDTSSSGTSNDSDNYDESKDLIVIEITSIIILVIICGVGYALFRCVVDRRDAQRELKILMSPTGLALLENEMKVDTNGQKSNKMSTNAKTLNDAFEVGNDGNTTYKLFHADN